MFSIKQHKAKLNSCSTGVIFMLHSETNGMEIQCLCRTALISLGIFFFICPFKRWKWAFSGQFSSLHLLHAQLRCEAAAKTEFLSNISMVKHFAFKGVLLCNPPAPLLCHYHCIHKSPWWIRMLKKPVLKLASLPNHCLCSVYWLDDKYLTSSFLTLWYWTLTLTIQCRFHLK